MEQLLPIVNKLQDVFSTVRVPPIELPQLVVVGSQSSGKSSVLEAIVGRDFLPRGSGIVTRRPLCLQLVNTKGYGAETAERPDTVDADKVDGSADIQSTQPGARSASDDLKADADGDGDPARVPTEWGEFLHKRGTRFTDFSEIRSEIERETDRTVGTNKGVSANPIILKIHSPYVLNLSLVDLPGVTKVPVGDQPPDIEVQIRNMIMHYISNPNSIIVAVSAANNDLANSDALKLAREVDPFGARTLGVITKVDLMDKGTDAVAILQGKVIPLVHGFVGVVNRSQEDIIKHKPISAALKSERQFFQTHPAYRTLWPKIGTSHLAKRLNTILMTHIKNSLPEIKARITQQIAETEDELQSYGSPLLDSHTTMGPLLLHLLSKFCNYFSDALDGQSPDVSVSELYGGARISYIFHDIFSQGLDEISPFDTLSDQDIRMAIRNATGPRPSLFVPEVSFELLVKKQITRLHSPSLQCVDLVFDELQRVCTQCETLVAELSRFPRLRVRIVECVRQLLRRGMDPTKHMISNLINTEVAYINTNHPDFIGGSRAVSAIADKISAQKAGGVSTIQDDNTSLGPTPAGSNINAGANSKVATAQPASAAGSVGNEKDKQQRAGLLGMLWGSGAPKAKAPAAAAPLGTGAVTAASSNIPNPPLPPGPPPAAAGAERGTKRIANVPYGSDMQHRLATSHPTDRELIETEVIKSLIASYFDLVRRNVQDSIPKAVMYVCLLTPHSVQSDRSRKLSGYFLVNHAKERMQSELVRTLYNPDLFEDLLREADDVSHKRGSCVELLSILRRALDIVNEVRDFNVFI